MIVTVELIYRCEPNYYLEQFFDAVGRERREIDGGGNVSFRVLESSREDDQWSHVIEVIGPVDAPAPVRKLIGETSRVEEHARWQRSTSTIEVEYVPDKMAKRVTMRSRLQATGLGDGTTRVKVEMDIQVRIFAVGGLMEKQMSKNMPKMFQKDAAFFNEHMAPA